MGAGFETSQTKQYRISADHGNPNGDVSHKTSCTVTTENQSVTPSQSLSHAKGILTGAHFESSLLMVFVLTTYIIGGPGSSVGTATDDGMDGPGIESR
jgi:hypothetical protein